MIFFIVAGLASSTGAFEKVTSAMGWSAAAACIVVLPGIRPPGRATARTTGSTEWAC